VLGCLRQQKRVFAAITSGRSHTRTCLPLSLSCVVVVEGLEVEVDARVVALVALYLLVGTGEDTEPAEAAMADFGPRRLALVCEALCYRDSVTREENARCVTCVKIL